MISSISIIIIFIITILILRKRGSAPNGGRRSTIVVEPRCKLSFSSAYLWSGSLMVWQSTPVMWFLGAGFLGAPPISLKLGTTRGTPTPTSKMDYIHQTLMLCWALLLKWQKGGEAVWAKSGHSAQYYHHMFSARLGMGEGERASTSAGSRAWYDVSCYQTHWM